MNDVFSSDQRPRHSTSARDFDDYTTISKVFHLMRKYSPYKLDWGEAYKNRLLKTEKSVRLSDDANGKIKKSNLEVIDLLKKLNIRSMINFYDGPIDSYDEFDNGLFAESLTEYGCWCLPQQNMSGIGHPMDELDQACYEFQTCLTCLRYDQCKNEVKWRWKSTFRNFFQEIFYEWHQIDDENQKQVYCSDMRETCQNNLCSCEVSLTKKLVELKSSFNPSFSAIHVSDKLKIYHIIWFIWSIWYKPYDMVHKVWLHWLNLLED